MSGPSRPTEARADGRDGRPPATGELERLIEAEARLEAALAQAREEAEERVRQAADEASRARQDAEAHMEASLAALADRLDAERERRLAEIEEQRALAVARYEEISAEELDRCAQRVLDRLLTPAGPEDEP